MNSKFHALGLVGVLLAGGLSAQQATTPAASHTDLGNAPGFRALFSLVEKDTQGKTTERKYEVVLDANGSGDAIRVGGRVPIRTNDSKGEATVTYQNTGLSLDCSLRAIAEPNPDNVNLTVTIEITTLAPGSTPGLPVFRTLSSRVNVRMPLGKTEQVAAFADPDSDTNYVLSAHVERDLPPTATAATH